MKVNVIGAGLAGSEACYYLLKKGYIVNLYEMRPTKSTEAHSTSFFSELVCSNSLKSNSLENACGILKEEMKLLGSIVLKHAYLNQVPAGECLAVSREDFSKAITDELMSFNNLNIINEEVTSIDTSIPTIICTGPLTSDSLQDDIKKLFGSDNFYFYDAQAPIIYADSIDYNIVYKKSRYDKGSADYLNCPFTKEEFDIFYNELINAKEVEIKDFELKVFEACMPIEVMAKRGYKTLLFGPLKPVGLEYNGKKPYAVVQLRQDDARSELYNIVGFQTHLLFGEQKRVFRLIPGLKDCNFAKFGRIHKNTYINSPNIINKYLQSIKYNNIFFAGQLSGVEGYVESACSGIIAAINLDLYLNNKEMLNLDKKTIIGSLLDYISTPSKDFQPMNANFGIVENVLCYKNENKKILYYKRSQEIIKELVKKYEL